MYKKEYFTKDYSKENSEKRIVNLIKEKNNTQPNYLDKVTATSASFQKTNKSLKNFDNEVKKRKAWNRIFSTKEEIESACDDFFDFILENNLYPTIELLSVWLNLETQSLHRIINNPADIRCDTVKKAREKILAILTQHTLTKEGNPAGNIFHLKSTFGLTETSNFTLESKNNNSFAPKNQEEILAQIPDEIPEENINN